MMHNFEKVTEVSQFINSKTSISKKKPDEEYLIQAIEQNFSHLKLMQISQNSSLEKLAFISSILRYHNLKCLTIEQTFDGVLFGSVEDKFKCTVVAESYNSDKMIYKNSVLCRFEELKKAAEEDNLTFTEYKLEMLKFQSVFSQKSKVKELYNKIVIQLNNDKDAALALTSFFIFEIDMLSYKKNKQTFSFFDLYELANPLDKWFAAIDIEQTKIKPIIYHITTRMH